MKSTITGIRSASTLMGSNHITPGRRRWTWAGGKAWRISDALRCLAVLSFFKSVEEARRGRGRVRSGASVGERGKLQIKLKES